MRMLAVGAALALVAARPAWGAGPVQLACQLEQKKHYEVALNESAGTASFILKETGYANSVPAAFTPSIISWTDHVHQGSAEFRVDRATLSFTEIEAYNGQLVGQSVGTCALMPAPKNKI